MAYTSPIGNTSSNVLGTGLAGQTLGHEEFLKLLVAQLKHQDPLSPMESHQFASQLAEFSSLEQLVGINDSVNQGVEADLILTQAINNTLAATLIGQEAKAVGNKIEYVSGESTEIHFQLNGFADDVMVEVRDQAGNVVKKINVKGLASGDHSVTWDGTHDNGEEMPQGNYSFTVTAKDSNGAIVDSQELIVGLISSVRFEKGSAMLVVGGREISFSSVLEIGVNN